MDSLFFFVFASLGWITYDLSEKSVGVRSGML